MAHPQLEAVFVYQLLDQPDIEGAACGKPGGSLCGEGHCACTFSLTLLVQYTRHRQCTVCTWCCHSAFISVFRPVKIIEQNLILNSNLLTLALATDGLVEADRTRAGGWAVGAEKPAWKVVHDFAASL